MRKVLENNELWMQVFFLAQLSNEESRKNKRNPSLGTIQGKMFYYALIKLERQLLELWKQFQNF
jgi:hypothetical protein